jgi:hypothetical protein
LKDLNPYLWDMDVPKSAPDVDQFVKAFMEAWESVPLMAKISLQYLLVRGLNGK